MLVSKRICENDDGGVGVFLGGWGGGGSVEIPKIGIKMEIKGILYYKNHDFSGTHNVPGVVPSPGVEGGNYRPWKDTCAGETLRKGGE